MQTHAIAPCFMWRYLYIVIIVIYISILPLKNSSPFLFPPPDGDRSWRWRKKSLRNSACMHASEVIYRSWVYHISRWFDMYVSCVYVYSSFIHVWLIFCLHQSLCLCLTLYPPSAAGWWSSSSWAVALLASRASSHDSQRRNFPCPLHYQHVSEPFSDALLRFVLNCSSWVKGQLV